MDFGVNFAAYGFHFEYRRPLAYDERNICSFRVVILHSGIVWYDSFVTLVTWLFYKTISLLSHVRKIVESALGKELRSV